MGMICTCRYKFILDSKKNIIFEIYNQIGPWMNQYNADTNIDLASGENKRSQIKIQIEIMDKMLQ